jgi:hypothetical protein
MINVLAFCVFRYEGVDKQLQVGIEQARNLAALPFPQGSRVYVHLTLNLRRLQMNNLLSTVAFSRTTAMFTMMMMTSKVMMMMMMMMMTMTTTTAMMMMAMMTKNLQDASV